MAESAPMLDVAGRAAPASTIGSLIGAVETTRDGVARLVHALAHERLGRDTCDAIDLLHAAGGRVIVAGMGKSGHIARKLAATLSSTGTPAYYLHPAEASHGDLGMINDGDVVVALSWSGETSEFAGVLAYVKRYDVPLIAITAGGMSTLARHATIALVLPEAPEACPLGLAPTTSTVMQLALGDAIAVALLDRKGFTAAQFGALHPGGRLGAQLKTVRDLMHAGGHLPLVPEGTVMGDAILEMSSKGFGIVGVVADSGDLVGVVTDGDLRRHMARDLLDQRVETVMSHRPVVITADVLAATALALMQERKISAVFVVGAGRPVGLLHMLDLVRSGVV
jgi:arabinose-5-phosphate isomerase